MIRKPKHLGRNYAETFKDSSVVEVYYHRPPHHPRLFPFLADLMPNDIPVNVWDLGCGTGDIARGMAPWAEHVDAVDFSAAMITKGKECASGDHPRIHWILGAAEHAQFPRTYGLITAGDSLGWMDWEVLFPRLNKHLRQGGYLALIERGLFGESR